MFGTLRLLIVETLGGEGTGMLNYQVSYGLHIPKVDGWPCRHPFRECQDFCV